jgi:hypothetical protein
MNSSDALSSIEFMPENVPVSANFSSDDAYYYCDECGDRFDSIGALNFHKTSFHYDRWKDIDSAQYDAGQTCLYNGTQWLWGEFKKEHALPDVVFSFDYDRYIHRDDYDKNIMPAFFKDKCKDLRTGLMYDLLSFSYQWKMLDPYAKAASLAHTAAHIEYMNSGRAVTKKFSHGRVFKKIAESYLLECSRTQNGWDATYATKKFKDRYKGACKELARYHPLAVVEEGRRKKLCSAESSKLCNLPKLI